ncbi:hypothetical protein BDR05DRAFT_874391 [Suillus weaverae]|nr:hypothetical protein BDR05DRAFT_874391 [Suillus weaverae]
MKINAKLGGINSLPNPKWVLVILPTSSTDVYTPSTIDKSIPIPTSHLTYSSFSKFLLQAHFNIDPIHRSFAYKKVANKVRPVPATMPAHACIICKFPKDPLLSLPSLSPTPPAFIPGKRLTQERMDDLSVFSNKFLWPEEQKLAAQVLSNNEVALAWDETEKGQFCDDYFPPVVIPTIEHIPWTHCQPPIPPGIKEEVLKLIKSKIASGIYEPLNSSYQSRWFCMAKKKRNCSHSARPPTAQFRHCKGRSDHALCGAFRRTVRGTRNLFNDGPIHWLRPSSSCRRVS